MDVKFKFDFGDKLRCKITGFEGIVICMTKWQTGCVRYGLKSPQLKDGKPMDVEFFDEPEVELAEPAVIEPPAPSKIPGGPKPNPPRHH